MVACAYLGKWTLSYVSVRALWINMSIAAKIACDQNYAMWITQIEHSCNIMIIERHKQICRSSYVWYYYPVALKVNSGLLLERTVLLVTETRFQVYKATGSAIAVTCTFWRNYNSSHKNDPRSLAIIMRVAMIYRTLVVAVLQLSRRRVYDVSIREPSPHPGYRYHHYRHGYFATCSLFLIWHSDCECLYSVLAAATMLAHLPKSAGLHNSFDFKS